MRENKETILLAQILETLQRIENLLGEVNKYGSIPPDERTHDEKL